MLVVAAYAVPVLALRASPRLLGLLAGAPFTFFALGDLFIAPGPARVRGQLFTLMAYVAAGIGLTLTLWM